MKRQTPWFTVRFQWLSILLLTAPSWVWWSLQAYIVGIWIGAWTATIWNADMRLYQWTSFRKLRASVHLKVCDYKTLVYFYHQKLIVTCPWSLFQTEANKRDFKVFLKHSWQLRSNVILPLSLMTRQTPWLAVRIRGYLSSCLTYSQWRSLQAYKFSILDRSLNYHHSQCRHDTLPFNFHSRIESFSLSALITLLFIVLTQSENVSIILSECLFETKANKKGLNFFWNSHDICAIV